jgi:hypothetical protein
VCFRKPAHFRSPHCHYQGDAVLVDSHGRGAGLSFDRSVLLTQGRIGPEGIADGEVVAERQRTLDDVCVRTGQARGLLEGPAQRDAEFAEQREAQPVRTRDAAAASCSVTTITQDNL